MSRTAYFDNIEEKLSILVTRVRMRNSLNLMDLNIQCEQTFKNILNLVYSKQFINSNFLEYNQEAFDLCDDVNKEIIQVTSTNSKRKIDQTLGKDKLNDYVGYNLKFLIIDNDTHLKRYDFLDNVPQGIIFNSQNDIISMKDILKKVLNMDIEEQHKLSLLVDEELSNDLSTIKTNSLLTKIINELAEKDLRDVPVPNLNEFEINRKIDFNNLQPLRDRIYTFKNYYEQVNSIYNEMDKGGFNKSLAALQHISDVYNEACMSNDTDVKIYLNTINLLCNEINLSSNFNGFTREELLYCVQILVVDAFIKCKIFKNPQGYQYVITR